MTLTLYGIPNCDTVRKARRWLDGNGIRHAFHDLRGEGLERDVLERWADRAGWQSLLNTRSTTFRTLGDKERVVTDRGAAMEAMLQHPTLIKRPVAERGETVLVGFNASEWENALC
ncbi:arsenate reductase [Erythrobacteraceae bacterium CFH 75059]|uniref:arsenate reductase n=1 Tax=Qipengyuania thermophila TaxID=2509361 RepID=UPI001021E9AB|nr:arsenate reductase [Qipengyuania thermophila]TCD04786.1 arsenate reductase [Erythrobacteraceae bacterium CFH 75059]